MPLQEQQTVLAPSSLQSSALQRFANRVLNGVLPHQKDCGPLLIHTDSGREFAIGGEGKTFPPVHLTLHHSWSFLRRLLLGWDVGFAEAYMAGEWTTPNLPALLKLASNHSWGTTAIAGLQPPSLSLRLRHALNKNTKRGSRRNISAHYDLGNAFYRQWLDAGMSYSSALYASAGQPLEDAQAAKQNRILELLNCANGDCVLEVGFGWGGLAERILAQQDVTLTGVTLSAQQLAYAQGRLDAASLEGRCDLRLQDYRDVEGTFDRIVSIEMLEAVGEAYWPAFFAKLRACLKPGGTALLQVITIKEECFDFYRGHPDFIQKYIFPGGMLPTPSAVTREAASAGLKFVCSERFGDSYGKTMADWTSRFQRAWPSIQELGFDIRFKRMWEYYLAYCQVGFEAGIIDVGLYKFSAAA